MAAAAAANGPAAGGAARSARERVAQEGEGAGRDGAVVPGTLDLKPAGAAAPGEAATVLCDEFGMPRMPHKTFGEPIVQVWGLSKEYELEGGGRVKALHDINLNMDSEFYPIRRGEFVMLRGASGGGKTTLLNQIGCIDRPSGGEIELFGRHIDLRTASDEFLSRLRAESIGWVFQSFNLLATLSAFENVELPMAVLGKLTKDERTARAKHLLRLVGLEDRMSHLPSELSGGEQQRVAIARALANEPELLLLDEAVADLDTRNQVEVMNLLLHINREQRATMIMVSHHDDLETYADRVLYIADGVIASQALNAEQIPLVPDSYVEYLNQG